MVRDSSGRFSSAASSASDDAPAVAPEPVPPIPADVAIVARVRLYRFCADSGFRRGPVIALRGEAWVWALQTAIEHGWQPAGTTLPGQLRGVWPSPDAESTIMVEDPSETVPWPVGYIETVIGRPVRLAQRDGAALQRALAGQELDPGLRMLLQLLDTVDVFMQ